jgi:hypothetical protein
LAVLRAGRGIRLPGRLTKKFSKSQQYSPFRAVFSVKNPALSLIKKIVFLTKLFLDYFGKNCIL